jgi:NADH-quinone oxidoreductase subunit M
LPEAHVEAPTPGSVILAGILLKLGTYGVVRFLVSVFFIVALSLFPFIFSVSFFGLFYASIIAFTQMDMKKMVAYSSISHMNFSLIGFFCNFLVGLVGSFFMMFGHSITSSSLFFGVGVIYDRYKTRLLLYLGGLLTLMPFFSALYFFFFLSNVSFPGTINFVGEFLILVGGVIISITFMIFIAASLVFTLVYSLFFLQEFFLVYVLYLLGFIQIILD